MLTGSLTVELVQMMLFIFVSFVKVECTDINSCGNFCTVLERIATVLIMFSELTVNIANRPIVRLYAQGISFTRTSLKYQSTKAT